MIIRPYDTGIEPCDTGGDDDDPVQMVWHNHERVQFRVGKMVRNIQPALYDKASRVIQPHLAVNHVTEQDFPVVRTDRHEVSPFLPVIIIAQTDGLPMVFLRVEPHGLIPFIVGANDYSPLP